MPSFARKSYRHSISEALFGHPPETIDIDREGYPPSPYTGVPCIYFIHLMEPKRNSGPFPIPRLMGIDLEGIVEIGMSSDIAKKMIKFKNGVLDTDRSDPEGWKLGYAFSKCKWMREIYGYRKNLLGSTRFSIFRTEKRYLRAHESKAIDLYCSRFAEPPVLNGQVPGVNGRSAGKGPEVVSRPSAHRNKAFDPAKPKVIDLVDSPRDPLTGLSCVYRVQLMDRNDPSRPFPIPRFIGTDPEGILTIGQTTDLAHKIRDIRYGIINKKGNGEWALLAHVYDLCDRLNGIYGPREAILKYLKLTYVETRPSLLRAGEIRATNRYMFRFGELPPMCSQIPGDPRKK